MRAFADANRVGGHADAWEVALARGREGFWQENADDKSARTGDALASEICPRCASTMSRAIDRPSPVPPVSRLREDFEPLERSESLLEGFGRYPRPVIATPTIQSVASSLKRHARRAAVAHRIVDQIREHPRDPRPLREGRHMIRPVILCLRARIGGFVAKAYEDGCEVERGRRIGACIAFREAQRLRQHVSHRIDVGEHVFAQLADRQ